MKEKLRKLELEKQREDDQKRIKDELLLRQAKEAEEKRKEEQRQKEIKEKAIEEFKRKEVERVAKEKKEKEEREREYQERYRRDLENLGLSSRDVSLVVKREVDLSKTTFTKMARRHISIETLRAYGVNWKLDDVSRFSPSYPSLNPTTN
jgi:regulator of protease activity HflC (stomatin/prohibitin superfamily)